ncbi:MAG: RagB/SusD family nutrient uptake outer membrane protein [Chitinophagaceae bacterium]|nr:MAG: RagB/SusD family nutrient uptake outer membrane protein [Chitinophagaceae bacterium]
MLLALSSCKKELDRQPFSGIPAADAFATADKCLLSLNGVYDAAQSSPYVDGGNRGYPFGAANIEQGEARGEDMINVAAFFQITYQATYNPTTANNNGQFGALYAMINKANLSNEGFIGAGTAGVITPAVALQYQAECRFLRAMAHHELVINYCRPYRDNNGTLPGVPYREVGLNSAALIEEAKTIPRGTVADVYTKILADLDFAEANLANTSSPVTVRASKGAVIALKQRVKLHMGDWPGAIAEGNKLIPAGAGPYTSPIGGWVLTPSPDGPFITNPTGGSPESVFSIRNDALDGTGVNAALSNMLGAANLGARGLLAISPIIFNKPEWLADDKRRSLLTVQGANANGSNATNNYFTTKYRRYGTMDDFAPQIRYAEVLLNQAEAEARQGTGVDARALDLLNAVRNRSLATPASQAYTAASFADKNAFISAILLERRIEFIGEGKRWPDIHRLAVDPDFSPGGIPGKVANGGQGAALYGIGVAVTIGEAAKPYSDHRFIWPIPDTEVIQNPSFTQNPNY